jgi:hypothetical protein
MGFCGYSDGFRAMGFYSHLHEGLANWYPNFTPWMGGNASKAIGSRQRKVLPSSFFCFRFS